MEKAKTKTIRTALDFLPDGAENPIPGKVQRQQIPQGINKHMLIKDLLLIACPSLLELVLTQLTSMADQVMVGRLPGEAGIAALSAVGLATQPKFLLMTLVQAMCVGTTAVVARYRGQQNQEKVQQAFRQTLILNLFVGIAFMLFGLAVAPFLVRFMSGDGISAETMAQGVEYFNIQMYGFIPLVLTFSITAALRGIGDNRIPLIYNTVANVVNLILNYIMIYGKFGCPAMGVVGASWATVIGQTVAFVIAAVIVFSGKHYIHFNVRKLFQFDRQLMGNVVQIGIPSMIEQLFMRAGVMIFTRAVASLGDALYATHQICMSIQALSFMMGQAFASATTTLMGQSLGKRRSDMAIIYMQYARNLGILASILLAAVLIVFNREIIGIYNTNEEVIRAGSGILILIAASQPIQATQFIISGGLRGAGDTKYCAFVIMITTLGVRSILGVITIQLLNWGLWGAWIALMMDQCLRSVLMVVRYNSGKWISIWQHNREKKAKA